MSLFSYDDYAHESKKNNVVSPRRASHGGIATSKKVRLPTQHRSPNHKCSLCERTDAKKYYLTEKECRWLCPACVIKNKNRDSKETVNFLKASTLGVKKMNESREKARKTRIENILKQKDHLTTYEKQAIKKKASSYVDTRRRID